MGFSIRRTSSLYPTIALAALFGFGTPAAIAQDNPASAGPVDPELLLDLIAANRTLAALGIVDAFGHVSVRHDKDPNRFLMSGSRAPELVSHSDIIEYTLDAVPIEPTVHWVGEKDGPVAGNDNVVRAIELLAIVVARDDLDLAVDFPDHAARCMLTR